MCGIVGAIADRDVVPVLIEGLKRLEYRGYDSAGIAVVDGHATCAACAAPAACPRWKRPRRPRASTPRLGIGHTRWATHGGVTEANAHPHISHGELARGAQRHHREPRRAARAPARARLRVRVADRHRSHRAPDPSLPARRATTCCAALQTRRARTAPAPTRSPWSSKHEPDRMVAARMGCPLLVGLGEGENFVAVRRLGDRLQSTRRVIFLEEGDTAEVTPRRRAACSTANGAPVERDVHVSDVSLASLELGPYRHFMQKEIHEQPRAVADTIEAVIDDNGFSPALFGANADAVLARHRRRADPRLRHQLLRRPDRALLDRSDRRHAVRGRDRQRIPLSRRGRQPEAADRHHLAVGRNARHDGSAEVRQVARPRHARCRSATCPRARSRAPASWCTTRAPAPRSAWPRPRPSPRSWWRCSR